jgi:hypothetical protein
MISWADLAPWAGFVFSIIVLLRSEFNGRSKKIEERFVSIETWLESKASKDQFGFLAGKLDIVEDKVTIVQNDFKHLPDKETTHRLELSIGEMRTEMRGLSEQMKPIREMVARVQDVVLEKVMEKT